MDGAVPDAIGTTAVYNDRDAEKHQLFTGELL